MNIVYGKNNHKSTETATISFGMALATDKLVSEIATNLLVPPVGALSI